MIAGQPDPGNPSIKVFLSDDSKTSQADTKYN